MVDRRSEDDVLRADGRRYPRLHLQQGRFRQARDQGSRDRRRILRRARKDQGERPIYAPRDRHRRVMGRGSARIHEYRPELLEGRGRPPGADRGPGEVHGSAVCRAVPRIGEVEALSPRWIRGRDRNRQPEHVHPWPGRDLSRGFVGNLRIQCSRRLQDGRVPAAGPQGRRSMLHHRSPGSRHRHEHQVQTSRRSQEVHGMADDAGIRRALLQRAARVLLAQHRRCADQGCARRCSSRRGGRTANPRSG